MELRLEGSDVNNFLQELSSESSESEVEKSGGTADKHVGPRRA
jgi:hypothetical protein